MAQSKTLLVKNIDPDSYREFKTACVQNDMSVAEVIRCYIAAVEATEGTIIHAVREQAKISKVK